MGREIKFKSSVSQRLDPPKRCVLFPKASKWVVRNPGPDYSMYTPIIYVSFMQLVPATGCNGQVGLPYVVSNCTQIGLPSEAKMQQLGFRRRIIRLGDSL